MFVSYYSEISLQLSGSDQQYGLPTIPEALCSVKRNLATKIPHFKNPTIALDICR